jgi:hypothetical protein
MHRRQFCVSGAVFAAGLAEARTFPAAMGPVGPPSVRAALYKIIFDTRYAASRAFGLAAADAGRMTAAIAGDVTALWSDDLRPQWYASRAAIAGMTTVPSFFCLQQLAKDHWMRAVVVADHRDGPRAHARVRAMVGLVPGDFTLPRDPRLVSWVIA